MTLTIRPTASPAEIECPRLTIYRRAAVNVMSHRAERIEACENLLRHSPSNADHGLANRILRHLCGPAYFHRSAANGPV